jgi:hypothetical protein
MRRAVIVELGAVTEMTRKVPRGPEFVHSLQPL